MRSVKKSLALLTLGFTLTVPSAFAQAVDISDITSSMDEFAEVLAPALPLNSAIGLNWSNAYIGQLLGIPPHFGVGTVVGATTIKAESFGTLLGQLGYPEFDLDVIPIPVAAVEARIGGFFLPFDLGLKVGLIPESVGTSLADLAGGLDVDYLLVGADLRYALLKGNILLPTISLGVGFNYMKGGLGAEVGSAQSFSFTNPENSAESWTIGATKPKVGLTWETQSFDVKAQISKGLLIFTPYLGVGASYSTSSAGYYVKSDITGPYEDLMQALEDAGQTVPDITATGIESTKTIENVFSARVFGGVSLNILVLRLDFSGLYNVLDGSYGASIGARIQL